MRENIKAIKFMAKCSVVFAVLTYAISVNIEIGFFKLNQQWISDNFALTVCGGVFASFFVVLLCEIQKYRSNKGACENFMFYQTMYLYTALYLMHRNIEEYINSDSQPIPENLLDMRLQMARGQLIALQSVDYITFCEKNELLMAYRKFASEELPRIGTLLDNCIYLKIAINKTKLKNLEQSRNYGNVTASDTLVLRTLNRINTKVSCELKVIDEYLLKFQNNCKDHFVWNDLKMSIHDGYVSIFETGSMEEFIQETEV